MPRAILPCLLLMALRAEAAGPFRIDVTAPKYGARPGLAVDSAPAFQAAVDDLATIIARARAVDPAFRTVATVFVPASVEAYRFARPVWVDSDFVEIRGEGAGSRVATMPGTCHPLFIFGMRRVGEIKVDGKPTRLAADRRYRPDLFGKLDATAAPASGRRGGFRTHGNAIIQSQGSPLSAGARLIDRNVEGADHFAEAKALTIEFAVEGPGGGPMPAVPIAGLGVATKGWSYPFHLQTAADNTFVVLFSTQSKRLGPATSRRINFSTGQARGVQRIAVQIDLAAPSVAVFADGVQIATRDELGEGWAPGLRFAENDFYPLLIGDAGGERPSLGKPNGFDFSLYGFLLSGTARYRTDGPGRPQRRRDAPSTRVDDRYRYFTPGPDDPGMIGHLAFTDSPSVSGRSLTVQGGPAADGLTGSALIVHSEFINQFGTTDNAVRDLGLIGGHIYGQNLAIAQVIDFKISGVRSTDAYHAVGSIPAFASYPIRVEDCTLDGSDSGYFGFQQILRMRDVSFPRAGRSTLRFVGCSVDADTLFVSHWTANNQATLKAHAADYGGHYAIRNMTVDYEGPAYGQAAFYCERHPYAPATSLRLTDIFLGTIGDVPLLMLKDMGEGGRRAALMVDNLQIFTDKFAGAIEVDGPAWTGEIRNSVGLGDAAKIIQRGRYGQEVNVRIAK